MAKYSYLNLERKKIMTEQLGEVCSASLLEGLLKKRSGD